MTAQEKAEIIKELREELLNEQIERGGKNCLKPTYDKWCKDSKGKVYESTMRKAFQYDGVAQYQAWECIRKLTCKIMGTSYVRQIKDLKTANHVADELCETVCNLLDEVRH